MSKLLVVDDEKNMRAMLRDVLESEGHEAVACADAESALKAMKRDAFDAAILDLNLPGVSGMELLRRMHESGQPLPVVMITAYGSVDSAVEAMRLGAFDFIIKPFDVTHFAQVVANCLESTALVRNATRSSPEFLDGRGNRIRIVGDDRKLQYVFEMIQKLARTEASVLIRGESGTGKELVAQAIHYNGVRKDGPFIPVNCSALPETLLESEFFGYEKGAFTGAASVKRGMFELADKGTIFLDEIGDMPMSTQVKLLRVLQEKVYTRLGGEKEVRVDVRVIAATNRDLEAMVASGEFREDLYYRLNVAPVLLPPLRERKGDIPPLVDFFVRRAAAKNNVPALQLSEADIARIQSYEWRGNIRELENAVERASVLRDSALIAPAPIHAGESAGGAALADFELPDNGMTLAEATNWAQREAIVRALRRTEGNKSEAAKQLGISVKTLYNKMSDLGIKLSLEVR